MPTDDAGRHGSRRKTDPENVFLDAWAEDLAVRYSEAKRRMEEYVAFLRSLEGATIERVEHTEWPADEWMHDAPGQVNPITLSVTTKDGRTLTVSPTTRPEGASPAWLSFDGAPRRE